jgi:hypothetical protein
MCLQIKDLQRSGIYVCANKGLIGKNGVVGTAFRWAGLCACSATLEGSIRRFVLQHIAENAARKPLSFPLRFLCALCVCALRAFPVFFPPTKTCIIMQFPPKTALQHAL